MTDYMKLTLNGFSDSFLLQMKAGETKTQKIPQNHDDYIIMFTLQALHSTI